MESEELDNDLFTNWVRGSKGLEYLQEGLQEFVGEKILQCRDQNLRKIILKLTSGSPKQCNQCTVNNLLPEHVNARVACSRLTCIQKNSTNCFGSRSRGRRKCPVGICSKLYDAIIDEHAFEDPLWKNTDPSTWCSDPHGWSYAKCFQTTKGPGTYAKDTDAAGLLSIIINNKSIHNFVSSINPHTTTSSFHSARDIRNQILHSAKLEIDETTVCSYLDQFIKVLQDPKCLINEEASKKAVHKLTQLKNNTVHISQEDTVSLLENRKKALTELDEKTAELLRKLDEKGLAAVWYKLQQAAVDIKKDAISDIEKAGKQALQDITESKNDIDGQKKEAISDIRIVKDNVIAEIIQTGTEANEGVLIGASAASGHGLPSRSSIVSELKDELIKWYNIEHSTVLLSPLTDSVPTRLAGFYVMPEIDIVHQNYLPGGRKESTRVKSLEDLFQSGRTAPREIYLSAVAGFGKTAFSKYLTLTWCQAHQKGEYYKHFKEEELKALSGFELLFLVILRDSAKDCDIDEMIEQQVLQNHPCSLSKQLLLKDILRDEKCLVILDGLDEWSHPDNDCPRPHKVTPHRYAREKCVILTTTRPWKLEMLNMNRIFETVELVKLNKVKAMSLKLNALKMIKPNLQDYELINDLLRFEEEIKGPDLEDMESTPLLLLYLICLWVEKIPVGNSAVELYTGIIQLLLYKTEKIHGKFHASYKQSKKNVPECFRKHEHFYSYYTFLLTIGELAFYTLFSKTNEHTLVFDKNVAEIYLTKEDLKSSYLSGILSESDVKTVVHKSPKISFSHRSVQEYFSAIFISFQNTTCTSAVQRIIFERCNCLQNILDMSKVFVFITNMNPKLMSDISKNLMHVINNDENTRKYRTMTYYTTNYSQMYIEPIQDIQDMYINCIIEGKKNKDLKLYLQDLIIDEKCRKENFFKELQYLGQQNNENIKSIMIDNKGICGVRKMSNLFTLSGLPYVEKIFYVGEIVEEDMMSFLLNTLKYLSVYSQKWNSHCFENRHCVLSEKINGRLVTLQHLEGLYMGFFTMTHEVMDTLLNFLTSKRSLKEIRLYNLCCSDHDSSCRGFSLDLSQHSQLRCLGLGPIPVFQFSIDVSMLEECYVGELYKPDVVSSYLSQLQAASKLQSFMCGDLESPCDIEKMLQTLPLLHHIKHVTLNDINLCKRSLTLSPEMINIESVDFWRITMSFSALLNLINVIKYLPNSVTVLIVDCDIKPETQFEKLKTFIKHSDKFVVTADVFLKSGRKIFWFKTTN